MLKLIKSAGILATVAVLLTGCSKSSSNNSGANAPQLTAPTFAGPTTTSSGADTSSMVGRVNGLATTFNAVAAGYTGIFQSAGTPKASGNTWTWSVSDTSGATITLTATQSDTTYQWKAVINGPYEGTDCNNWTAFSGSETASGANGDWTLYNINSTTPMAQVSWSTDASGTLTGTIAAYDSTGAQAGKYVFTNKKDNSGELDQYGSGNTLVLKVTWTGTGSGQWWEYDGQGNVVASGSWS